MTDAQRLLRVIDERAVKAVLEGIQMIWAKLSKPWVQDNYRLCFEMDLSDGRSADGQLCSYYGVAAVPPADCRGVAVDVPNITRWPVVGSIDPQYVLKDLQEGDVALYRRAGAQILLRGSSVEVTTPSGATVTISDAGAVEVRPAAGQTITLGASGAATSPVARVGDSVVANAAILSWMSALATVTAVPVPGAELGTIASGSQSVRAD